MTSRKLRLLIPAMFALSALAILPLAIAAADDSLAQHVPAEVGLFVEVRGSEDLLVPLAEPRIWIALAELAGQPASVEDAKLWQRRIQQTVKMKPTDAIRLLFSDRVAFVGDAPGRAQDAVVLCALPASVQIPNLLQQWQALQQSSNAGPDRYTLRNGIGLAVHDRLFVFGDATRADGMFQRTLRHTGKHSRGVLADDPVYRGLLVRVPRDPDGVLFARLARGAPILFPTSRPSAGAATQPSAREALTSAIPELPGPLRGASNALFALHRDGQRLHFTVVGDGRVRSKHGQKPLRRLVETLPERTLIAWAHHVDYASLLGGIEALPEQNFLRLAVRILTREGSVDKLLGGLDSSNAIAVGTVWPRNRGVAAPPVPAVALLVSTKDAAVVAETFEKLQAYSASIYNLLSLKHGLPRLPERREVPIGATTAHLLDLSHLIRGHDGGAIGELHACWAMDGDVLVIASHLDWLREIIEARHQQRPTLASTLRLARRPISDTSETVIVVQSGPVSDLGAHWLDFLKRHAPAALEEKWWRDKQPGGSNVQLGITVREEADNKRLRVLTVADRMPAGGHLRPGDGIVGCNQQRFATTQPRGEIQTSIANRPNARWLDLLVEREGRIVNERIPLPFVDPVELLRRAVALGKIGQRVIYFDEVPDAGGPRGSVTVELRTNQAPLFDFAPKPLAKPVGDGETGR